MWVALSSPHYQFFQYLFSTYLPVYLLSSLCTVNFVMSLHFVNIPNLFCLHTGNPNSVCSHFIYTNSACSHSVHLNSVFQILSAQTPAFYTLFVQTQSFSFSINMILISSCAVHPNSMCLLSDNQNQVLSQFNVLTLC